MDVVAIPTGSRHVVVRGTNVDLVLDDGGEGHGERSENKAPSDTSNRIHGEACPAEERVDNLIENGNKDDDDERVDVLHFVVGDAVQLHGTGLCDEVGVELIVNHPVNWVEGEDLAGHEGAAKLVNKGLAPRGFGLSPYCGLEGRAGGVEVAVSEADPESSESVWEDGASRWAGNVKFTSHDQNGEADHESDETREVDGPEALVFLHEDGSDEAERADVDTPVEDHVDALESNTGVLDNAFAALEGLDLHPGFCHLFRNQRADI